MYKIIPNRTYRNAVLLLASLVFYSWGEPKLVFLMVCVAFVAYIGGLLIEKFRGKGISKFIFVITTVLILANLLYFKYINFFVNNLNHLGFSITIGNVELPIGISFYTFQILSYVIDLYWGNVKVQKNFPNLLLYLCFFPQLIAGPIVRYSTVEYEITNRKENFEDVVTGVKRFIIGLAKKAIIANGVAMVSDIIYAGDVSIYGTAMQWLAAVAYSLQLYFDFSAYSDMAIGLGLIFGFHFLENFNYPYISCSVTEFWRRWHMSLSTWFRDYIYIPLGGNRVSKPRWMFNIMVVWALTGFWHGASWNFVLWGLYYGVLLMLEKLLLGKLLEKLPKFIGWIYTMFIVIIGWVLFNITSLSGIATALTNMFTYSPTNIQTAIAENTSIIQGMLYMPLGLVFMFPVAKLFKNFKNHSATLILENIFYLAIFGVSVVICISSKYNPFIYFRF
ncbi:MAG: MBOAT family protein [Clostridia bacterium]|nr:MBOAT family protein [Clostridia bacterium]